MISKFRINDRVRVYDCSNNYVCIVTHVYGDGLLSLKNEEIPGGCPFIRHEKQCRKIKSKARRSIWIKTSGALSVIGGARHLEQSVALFKPEPSDGWIEFVEKKEIK